MPIFETAQVMLYDAVEAEGGACGVCVVEDKDAVGFAVWLRPFQAFQTAVLEAVVAWTCNLQPSTSYPTTGCKETLRGGERGG
jgi:hypothetical protein